jgi:hypothetical protein
MTTKPSMPRTFRRRPLLVGERLEEGLQVLDDGLLALQRGSAPCVVFHVVCHERDGLLDVAGVERVVDLPRPVDELVLVRGAFAHVHLGRTGGERLDRRRVLVALHLRPQAQVVRVDALLLHQAVVVERVDDGALLPDGLVRRLQVLRVAGHRPDPRVLDDRDVALDPDAGRRRLGAGEERLLEAVDGVALAVHFGLALRAVEVDGDVVGQEGGLLVRVVRVVRIVQPFEYERNHLAQRGLGRRRRRRRLGRRDRDAGHRWRGRRRWRGGLRQRALASARGHGQGDQREAGEEVRTHRGSPPENSDPAETLILPAPHLEDARLTAPSPKRQRVLRTTR